MRVWLVERYYPYESSNILVVFSTEEKALRYIARQAAEGRFSGAHIRHYSMDVDPEKEPDA